jgi:hypothetical protein
MSNKGDGAIIFQLIHTQEIIANTDGRSQEKSAYFITKLGGGDFICFHMHSSFRISTFHMIHTSNEVPNCGNGCISPQPGIVFLVDA